MKKSLEHEYEKVLTDVPITPSFPMAFVNEKQLPEIKNWKVGEEYVLKNVTIRMKMVNMHMENKMLNADIELLSYEHDAKQNTKSLS